MFSYLNTELTLIFTHFDITKMASYMLALKSFLIIYLGLMITIKGYLVLAGKYPQPIKNLVYEMILWSIIISFAFNIDNHWVTLSATIDEIHTWAGGGVNLYAVMDKLVGQTSEISTIFIKASSFYESPFIAILVWGGFLMASAGITFILIGTTFTLKLLILVAPLAIAALLFGWIKQTFTNWLVLLLSNALTVLLIGIIIKVVSISYDKFMQNILFKIKAGDVDYWLGSIGFLVFGLFIAFITKNVLNLASGMAGGGIDSMATRATQGMASNALNAGRKAGGMAGRGVGRAGKAAGGYVAGKIAAKFGKGK